MTETEFKELVEDIRVNGQSEPITLYENKILDGRNRYNACKELDIEPKFKQWEGQGSVVAKVVSLNLRRHQYTYEELGKLAVKLKPLYVEEAKLRQKASQAKPGEKIGTNVPCCSTTPFDKGEVNKIVGDMLGISKDTVMRTSKVAKDGIPELYDSLGKDLTIAAAYEISKLPPEQQSEKLDEIKQGIKRERRTKAELQEIEESNRKYLEENPVSELTDEDLELKALVQELNVFLSNSLQAINIKVANMKDRKNVGLILEWVSRLTNHYNSDINGIIKMTEKGVYKGD